MTEIRHPQTVVCNQGRLNIPEAIDVDYSGEITDEFIAIIDELAPKEASLTGKLVKQFKW